MNVLINSLLTVIAIKTVSAAPQFTWVGILFLAVDIFLVVGLLYLFTRRSILLCTFSAAALVVAGRILLRFMA
jgi:hypothetical protein